jgi:glycosyltransferase involved in cell wall biosynthesis
LGIPEGQIIIGCVAVFRKAKKLEDWIDAAKIVAGKRNDVVFLLVGHGPNEASLRGKIKGYGLEERIKMPGFREDARRIMSIFDIFFLTSEHEGLPIAMLEAMALAKPVVSTRAGGISEIVENGIEGLLSPVGAVEELAKSLLNLISDKELRRKMGSEGEQKVKKLFQLKDRVSAVEKFYEEAVNNDGK